MPDGKGDGWTAVRIRKGLVQRIREAIEKDPSKMNAHTPSGFVNYVVARRLDEIEESDS